MRRTSWKWGRSGRPSRARAGRRGESRSGPQRHVSGQELCEAIRRYALEQYGYMAKTVLNSWGIHGTNDFGEIVFNLIRIGQMRKDARRHPRGLRQHLRFRRRVQAAIQDHAAGVNRLKQIRFPAIPGVVR